jgi:hypothetical protein
MQKASPAGSAVRLSGSAGCCTGSSRTKAIVDVSCTNRHKFLALTISPERNTRSQLELYARRLKTNTTTGNRPLHKLLDFGFDARTLVRTNGKLADSGRVKGLGDPGKRESKLSSFAFQSSAAAALSCSPKMTVPAENDATPTMGRYTSTQPAPADRPSLPDYCMVITPGGREWTNRSVGAWRGLGKAPFRRLNFYRPMTNSHGWRAQGNGSGADFRIPGAMARGSARQLCYSFWRSRYGVWRGRALHRDQVFDNQRLVRFRDRSTIGVHHFLDLVLPYGFGKARLHGDITRRMT